VQNQKILNSKPKGFLPSFFTSEKKTLTDSIHFHTTFEMAQKKVRNFTEMQFFPYVFGVFDNFTLKLNLSKFSPQNPPSNFFHG